MAGRRPTAAQARDKRSKKMVMGLGVLLVIVGVVQGPKLMKSLSPPKPPSDPAAVAVVEGSPAQVSAGTDSASSPDAPAGTQLKSVSRLKTKDPFHSQIDTGSTSSPIDDGVPGTPPATGKLPAVTVATTTTTTPTPTPAPATPAASAGPTGAVGFTLTPPNAALIRTNGRRQVVLVGDGFPSGQPLFRLTALGKKGIRFSVVGGSFTSGVPTLLLQKGHKIALANEADGTHYVIQLVRLTNADPAQAQPGATPAPGAAAAPAATPSAG